jgi:hypothetical protein
VPAHYAVPHIQTGVGWAVVLRAKL